LSVARGLVDLFTCISTRQSPTLVISISQNDSPSQTHLIQRPGRIAGQRKVRVERDVHDVLGGIAHSRRRLDLGEAVADEPDAVDEQAVCGALDLEVAEEGVGAEEGEDLVEDVVALAVRVGGLVRGERWRGEGECVGRATGLGAQGQKGEVAY
jgi:hypothetical protein